jgi:tetratricopeptide (TPR) repeat protein
MGNLTVGQANRGFTAVFSGAGISGAQPAGLPLGNSLRNDILTVIFDRAWEFDHARDTGPPAMIDRALLLELQESPTKLEVVVGRLSSTVGPVGKKCLLALRTTLPNEAHMLAALHLARGGSHVTLNFDTGVELAYQLLTGEAELPEDAPAPLRVALDRWQSLVPEDPPALRVLCEEGEFSRWDGELKHSLFKLHGSLDPSQTCLRSPIVVDTEQLHQLSQSRMSVLDGLRRADQVVATGYSGEDIDIYLPLLEVLSCTSAVWTALGFRDGTSVQSHLHQRAIPYVIGDPAGLATTALRQLLNVDTDDTVHWPEIATPGSSYAHRFGAWTTELAKEMSPPKAAEVMGWLLADLGNYDTAVALLDKIQQPSPRASIRIAEALYQRNAPGDRARSRSIYRGLVKRTRARSYRLHGLLRLGDISRGDAARRPWRLVPAFLRPIQVLALTAMARNQDEARSDAYRALQQTSLRVIERAIPHSPTFAWPMLASACRVLSRLGSRAELLTKNGNRLSLVRQQRLTLLGLSALLSNRHPEDTWSLLLEQTARAYEYGNDLAGAGNCTASLALHYAARDDRARAEALLKEAADLYSASRPDAPPPAAGTTFLGHLSAILAARDRARAS